MEKSLIFQFSRKEGLLAEKYMYMREIQSPFALQKRKHCKNPNMEPRDNSNRMCVLQKDSIYPHRSLVLRLCPDGG